MAPINWRDIGAKVVNAGRVLPSKMATSTKSEASLARAAGGDPGADLLALSVLPGVSLTISASWAAGNTAAGVYNITGPKPHLETLAKLCGTVTPRETSDSLRGVVSPPSAITVPREHRKGAGIPLSAANYCYIHPLDHLAEKLEKLKLAKNSWAFVLLTGGFAYFDEHMALLAINAIALAPSPTGLVLVGYPVAGPRTDNAAAILTHGGRLVPIRHPDLVRAGFDAVAWVHGLETFEGAPIAEERQYPHGAFLYHHNPAGSAAATAAPIANGQVVSRGAAVLNKVLDDDDDAEIESLTMDPSPSASVDGLESLPDSTGGQLYLYALEPVTPEQYKKIAAAPSSRSAAGSSTGPADTAGPPSLSAAMLEQRLKCIAAQDVIKEASKLTSLEEAEKTVEPLGMRMRRHAGRMTAIGCYLAIGVLFYGLAEETEEDDSSLRHWTYTESLYFSVVTISTVGYGDISPSNGLSRNFTGIYMLFGVAVVFGIAGELYEAATAAIEEGVAYVWKSAVQMVMRGTRAGTADAAANTLPSAWRYYMQQLVPTLLIGISLTLLLSAYIFTLTQPDLPYLEALWHCWVTCTTVGYGDVSLTTEASMRWASVHILVSVSWLASLLSRVTDSYQRRQWDLQKANSMRMQLSEGLFAALETSAARAEGRGVNELEFVAGMIIMLGAEVCGEKLDFAQHVKPLIDRFRVLDDDCRYAPPTHISLRPPPHSLAISDLRWLRVLDGGGSGYLTPEDIAFMVKKANQAREQTVGLNWESIGPSKLADGAEYENGKLSEALSKGRTTFTQADLEGFGAEELTWESCVETADGQWFRPTAQVSM